LEGGARARGLDLRDLSVVLPPGSFWLHDSLCSTTDGHDFCDTIERASGLAPITRTMVPASPSLPGADYTSSSVELVLERVTAAKE
jgi:hypothetical protein